ncbi:hypothetical protein, partial [Enterococcus faecium]|uniref:hypothetical protein n=1 Tax=Enterococcus faecium TaxID=1352 RepID=UPI001CC50F1C
MITDRPTHIQLQTVLHDHWRRVNAPNQSLQKKSRSQDMQKSAYASIPFVQFLARRLPLSIDWFLLAAFANECRLSAEKLLVARHLRLWHYCSPIQLAGAHCAG